LAAVCLQLESEQEMPSPSRTATAASEPPLHLCERAETASHSNQLHGRVSGELSAKLSCRASWEPGLRAAPLPIGPSLKILNGLYGGGSRRNHSGRRLSSSSLQQAFDVDLVTAGSPRCTPRALVSARSFLLSPPRQAASSATSGPISRIARVLSLRTAPIDVFSGKMTASLHYRGSPAV
jgi:hypothetical protein